MESSTEKLWLAEDVEAFLQVEHRYLLERLAVLPTFPKAIRLPLPTGGHSKPRWVPSEIRAWALQQRAA